MDARSSMKEHSRLWLVNWPTRAVVERVLAQASLLSKSEARRPEGHAGGAWPVRLRMLLGETSSYSDSCEPRLKGALPAASAKLSILNTLAPLSSQHRRYRESIRPRDVPRTPPESAVAPS